MIYRIYLKDWYYNAGLVGFLYVLNEGNNSLDNLRKNYNGNLKINDNYIEINKTILDGFYEKYEKLAFSKFFNLDEYKNKLMKFFNILSKEENVKIDTLLKKTYLNNNINKIFFKALFDIEIEDLNKQKIYKQKIEKFKEILDNLNNSTYLYDYLVEQKRQQNVVGEFLNLKINKEILGYKKVKEYIEKIKGDRLEKTNENKFKCFTCNEFTKSYEFNNSITQVIGFNSDNSNWIWGFDSSKVKICSLCALIYSCTIHALLVLNRKTCNKYQTSFYFINHNTNIETLYNSFCIFNKRIKEELNKDKPFYTLLQDVVLEIINQESKAVLRNINFIEIHENQFRGKMTKNYNVYNYNISREVAEFIKSIGKDKIPKGYYEIQTQNNKEYYDITEGIIKDTLNQSLSYNKLGEYFYIYLSSLVSKKVKCYYSLYNLTLYILKFINKIKGGNMIEKIIKKAFKNGSELREKILEKNKKIEPIAYQLLNDLKICDRNSFMDKYLRLCISYNVEVSIGSHNELVNLDNFMSFGYAFLNGLLKEKKESSYNQYIEGENNN